MTSTKKQQAAHAGARVRVANEQLTGAERWHKALRGTISGAPAKNGARVLLDGEPAPEFVLWADLDVIQKPRPHLQEIPIAEVRPSRWQYRKTFDAGALLELAESIREHGLINAVLVFEHESGGFELIAGERRLRAMYALAWANHDPDLKLKTTIEKVAAGGWADDWLDYDLDLEATIRAEVRPGTAEDHHQTAVIENLQRENPSPIEEAQAFNVLLAANDWSQVDLSKHLHKSKAYVSQRLALLGLSDEAQAAAHAGAIPFASARAVATVPKPLQGQLTDQIQTDADPATTRQVQALAAQVKRFFDPDTWQPDPDIVIDAPERNTYRLMRYHVRYLMDNDPDQVNAALAKLKTDGTLGKRAGTIAHRGYLAGLALNALTGAEHDPYGGIGPWWAALAQLKGYKCDQCRIQAAAAPEAEIKVEDAYCPRWAGETPKTCPGWIGPEDPVIFFLGYKTTRALAEHGEGLDLEVMEHDEHRYGYLTSVNDYRDLVALAAKVAQDEEAKLARAVTHGHLDTMADYWAQQPGGLAGVFDLANAQAHDCRLCLHHRPEVANDPDAIPCTYASQPLTSQYGDKSARAPGYGVLVRSDGVMVPRCERFHYAEMPPLAPVKGVQFPTDKAGRALIMEWLDAITRMGHGHNTRNNTIYGPLAWLPYSRPLTKPWDRDLMISWIRGNWAECDGDPGVARLLSVALSETKARQGYEGSFDLLNPITGEIERWAALSWQDWRRGEVPYSYPDYWPKPEGGIDGAEED